MAVADGQPVKTGQDDLAQAFPCAHVGATYGWRLTVSEGTSGVTEPNWLIWAREIEALAQTGLAFTRDEDDRARYERLGTWRRRSWLSIPVWRCGTSRRAASSKPAMPRRRWTSGGGVPRRPDLLVRDTADGDRWTLPAGWAEMNQSPGRGNCRRRARRRVGRYELSAGAVLDRSGTRINRFIRSTSGSCSFSPNHWR